MNQFCNGDCSTCRRLICINLQGSHDTLETELLRHSGPDGAICFKGFRIVLVKSPDDADVVLDAVDCRNLENSLLRTTHIMDTGRRMVMAFDHYEEFLSTGHSIDIDKLSLLLGIPVVNNSYGLGGLLDAVISIYNDRDWQPKTIQGRHIDEDEHARLGFVTGALQETVIHSRDNSLHTFSQKVDTLLTNRWLGFPLLILVLFGVFEATFALGAYPQMWIEDGVDLLSGWMKSLLPDGWLSSLLTDGIIAGVGAVLAFLPNIVILFFFLSLLEDSGYMSRAAFIMDKVMHSVGLHGNSFIPMLIGFGCNVPAIMAARSIENRKDRTLTILMIPFMSCSARLPVYLLFVSAFFARYKALMMVGIYLTGIVIAILFAFVMKRTSYFRKGVEDYVSELPPFHAPKIRDSWHHIWDRVKDYLQKISSVILIASVVIWALEYFPADKTENGADKDKSCLAMIGKAVEPVMAPLGFDWKMNVCLLTGLPAKEAIVSTMGILYNSGDEDSLAAEMRENSDFNIANSLSFLIFVLLYFPCIATVAAISREAGKKWAAFTVVHSLALAWVLALAVFQTVSLFI